MVSLVDGPCEGAYAIKRAPVYLRAVLGDAGEKDVLDLIEDTPAVSEKVYVYQLVGEPGYMHIRGAKIHGFFATGTYRYIPTVDGETLRKNEDWQTWATTQMGKG